MKREEILPLIFFKLCGVPADPSATVSRAEFTLRHGDALGWMIALTLALGALTWWSYRRDTREIISCARRGTLVALRTVLFALLLLLILRPVLVLSIMTSIQGRPTPSTVDAELWSSPAYLLLLTLIASAEWALRKRWQLK